MAKCKEEMCDSTDVTSNKTQRGNSVHFQYTCNECFEMWDKEIYLKKDVCSNLEQDFAEAIHHETYGGAVELVGY